MNFRQILILLPLILTSCGYRKWWGHTENQRKMASASLQKILREDDASFEQHTFEKLTSLHFYTMVGHKNLAEFDEILDYESIPYQNLMALRTQIDELEHDLKDEYIFLMKARDQKKLLALRSFFVKFAGLSKLHALSMENLMEALNLGEYLPQGMPAISAKEIEEHYKSLQLISDFQIHEKNIDHLSHMIDLKFDSDEKKFVPSVNKMGSITGQELPQKVWALTFDDGPSAHTQTVLRLLKKRELTATFFPLMEKVQQFPDRIKELSKSNMEIGAHAWSHSDLTKAGNLTLDKEITEAIQKLGRELKTKIGLYRLPYGTGLNSSHIRERIAQNEVINVFWSVDALDWMPQESGKIADRTLKLMKKSSKDSGIILFHDTHHRTVLSLPTVLDYLKKDGRKVCTVGQIVQDMNQGAPIVCR